MTNSHSGSATASLVDTGAVSVRSRAERNGLLGGAVGVSLISVFFSPNTSLFFFLPVVLAVVALRMVMAAPGRQAECPWCNTVITMARHRLRCNQIECGDFDEVVGRFGPA
jgi:hypothetical protein